MSELEGRVARLERAYAGTGNNIHQYDDPDQAAAHVKQQEADRAAEVKQQKEAQHKLDAVQAQADLEQAEAVNRAATEDLKQKRAAVKKEGA